MRHCMIDNKINNDLLFRSTKDNTVFYRISNGDIFAIKNILNNTFRNIIFNEKLFDQNVETLSESKKVLIEKGILLDNE